MHVWKNEQFAMIAYNTSENLILVIFDNANVIIISDHSSSDR